MRRRVSEFVEHLDEVFDAFGPIESRRMFGGYGIYHDGLMFGLVADDVLYLKADDRTAALFTERDLPPFQYTKKGRQMTIAYYAAPDEIFDDQEQASVWALRAFESALRARKT